MSKLQGGEVPETIMMGQTAEILSIAEFGWCDWVFYNEQWGQFPDVKLLLGRYLGPEDTEVVSVMTATVFTKAGEVIHRSAFRHLTPAGISSESKGKDRGFLDTAIEARLGELMIEMEHRKSFGS
jgi:hypothetical protein